METAVFLGRPGEDPEGWADKAGRQGKARQGKARGKPQAKAKGRSRGKAGQG